MDFLYFKLGEGEQSSGESAWCARKELDGVVPNRVGREPLRLLFAEDFRVTLVASGDFLVVDIFFRRMQRDLAYEVSVIFDRLGSVSASREEFCLFHIRASEY